MGQGNSLWQFSRLLIVGGFGLLSGALVLSTAWAESAPGPSANSLGDELEWLAEETFLYSASRHEGNLFQADSAACFISSADISSSGATSIPELLRMAPGVNVSRISASQWAVSMRGFNLGRWADKLLVMIDGRTIYTLNYGGVFWEPADMVLEDIERIEIIRGPGSSLWGTNAVNGIINIITKSATDTGGTLVGGRVGNKESGAYLRHGGEQGRLSYRLFAKAKDTRGLEPDNEDARDGWDQSRLGYRLDYIPSTSNNLMVGGEAYRTRLDDAWPPIENSAPHNRL